MGKSGAVAKVPFENQGAYLWLKFEVELRCGQPKTLYGVSPSHIIIDCFEFIAGKDNEMCGACDSRYEVHFDTCQPSARQIPIKKGDTLPALHHPLHEAGGDGVEPYGLVGNAIMTVPGVPFDDGFVHLISFGHGQAQFRIVEHQFRSAQPVSEIFQPEDVIGGADGGFQRFFFGERKRACAHASALYAAKRDIGYQGAGGYLLVWFEVDVEDVLGGRCSCPTLI